MRCASSSRRERALATRQPSHSGGPSRVVGGGSLDALWAPAAGCLSPRRNWPSTRRAAPFRPDGRGPRASPQLVLFVALGREPPGEWDGARPRSRSGSRPPRQRPGHVLDEAQRAASLAVGSTGSSVEQQECRSSSTASRSQRRTSASRSAAPAGISAPHGSYAQSARAPARAWRHRGRAPRVTREQDERPRSLRSRDQR